MTSSHISNNRLSIRCFADGFSFYVYRNGEEFRVLQRTQIKENLLAIEVIKEIQSAFPNHTPEIQIIVHSSAFRIVPNQLFRTEYAADFLATFPEAKKLLKPRIATDELINNACTNVYYTLRWVEQLSEKLNAENIAFTMLHDISLLINSVMSKPQNTQISVFAHKEIISLVAFKNNELLLANKFAYHTSEDVLYHVLNCCKQLELPTEKVHIKLTGEVDLAQIKSILSNYLNL